LSEIREAPPDRSDTVTEPAYTDCPDREPLRPLYEDTA
jgi:hypothetical protein